MIRVKETGNVYYNQNDVSNCLRLVYDTTITAMGYAQLTLYGTGMMVSNETFLDQMIEKVKYDLNNNLDGSLASFRNDTKNVMQILLDALKYRRQNVNAVPYTLNCARSFPDTEFHKLITLDIFDAIMDRMESNKRNMAPTSLGGFDRSDLSAYPIRLPVTADGEDEFAYLFDQDLMRDIVSSALDINARVTKWITNIRSDFAEDEWNELNLPNHEIIRLLRVKAASIYTIFDNTKSSFFVDLEEIITAFGSEPYSTIYDGVDLSKKGLPVNRVTLAIELAATDFYIDREIKRIDAWYNDNITTETKEDDDNE